MPECPPWAPRHFARSCGRVRARSPHVPRSTRERAKYPASAAERRRHFARSCGAGQNRAAGGVESCRLEARVGLPGSPRASRRSPAVLAARVRTSGRNIRVRRQGTLGISPARLDTGGRSRDQCGGVGERAEYRGASTRRPRHFARSAGRGRAEPRPGRDRGRRAGEVPGCVRRVTAAFRPLVVTRRGRSGSARQAGWRATAWRRGAACRGNHGPPGGRLHRVRLASRTSGRNTRVRPQGDRGISPARASDARNETERAGTGRHGWAGVGGRSGTYGRHTGRE